MDWQNAFPPPFREVVDHTCLGGRPGLLAVMRFHGQLTVARQRRTCTGFAFEHSHPGDDAPGRSYEVVMVIVCAQRWNVKSGTIHGRDDDKNPPHKAGGFPGEPGISN